MAAPTNASNWRMLAKILHHRGDLAAAEEALQRALVLDPQSPAIHLDLGSLLLERQQVQAAIHHFSETVRLAPDSEQGEAANLHLNQLSFDPQFTMLVAFEAPWIPRPQPEDVTAHLHHEQLPARRLAVEVDAGALFNSNVELAPISRQLSSAERGGFQTYIAPEFHYLLHDSAAWQLGTSFDAYVNVNESHLSAFNLQHYQPGVYFDYRSIRGETELVTRVNYEYAIDLFDGEVFGNKQALTTSLTAFHDRPMTTLLYWTIDYTDFRDDGAVPDFDSLDGLTNTVGMSRSWEFDQWLLRRLDLGADAQWADVRGSDQKYRGIFVYSEARTACLFGSELVASGGWGYRDYPEFSGDPSRNEILYVAGLQLDRRISENWRCTLFFNYDSFDTPNTTYSAERYRSGWYIKWEH
ncbi:MAG TPA: tetratricopeptide repeat protein [Pirellulaceae bacterium]|nr:tetratricopeptide repeat protein [Pirellulaceae bacterium]